jgi:hypothetical protein
MIRVIILEAAMRASAEAIVRPTGPAPTINTGIDFHHQIRGNAGVDYLREHDSNVSAVSSTAVVRFAPSGRAVARSIAP